MIRWLTLLALIFLAAGCATSPVYQQSGVLVEISVLEKELGMTAHYEHESLIFANSAGTIVFNPRVYGIIIGSEVCYRGYRPFISKTHVGVPSDFIAKCRELFKPVIPEPPKPLPPVVVKKPVPLKKYHVVLDPGHGGKDPGTTGLSGVQEKKLNLTIAMLVASKLRDAGVEVSMTRSDDTFIELNERAAKANRINADAFIAFHADYSPNRSTNGFTVFVVHSKYTEAERAVEVSDEIALPTAEISGLLAISRSRSNRLASHVRSKLVTATGTNRAVQPGAFRVLKRSMSPAILVEVGFMSNPDDDRLLLNYAHQNKIATAIATGITSFLNN